jgi:ABC-type sugar transport system permease subunit
MANVTVSERSIGSVSYKNKNSLPRRIVKNRYVYLALLPALMMVLVFDWFPAASALYNSFFLWNGGKVHKFVGLQNYENLLFDRAFITSLKNVAFFVIFRVVFQIVLPFIAAELVVNLRSASWAYRWKLIFVIPMVVPYLVMVLIWRFIYNPQVGLLNQFLTLVGLESWTNAWLADPSLAIWAISFVRFPWLPTLQFLIILGGLQAINTEVIESSQIDGAGLLQRIRFIDIPMSMGQIKLAIILTAIFMTQRFDLFLVLTDGGPGYSTMVPALHLYHTAFNFLEFGYASAIGVILFVIMMTLTVINLRYVQSDEG